jgi:hypothetical protein
MVVAEAVHFDPAEPQDLPGAWAVYLAASDPASRDATRRPDPSRPEIPPRLYAHLLATCEGAFWVARAGEQIVGFAAATSRGTRWFVSELWVAPGFAGRGIGGELYRLVKRSTRGLRGRVRAALAGDDAASLALGLRDGMQARFPVFRVHGDAAAVERLWTAAAGGGAKRSRLVAYEPRAGAPPNSPLNRIDQQVRGEARPSDHLFWLSDRSRRGFVVWLGKRAVAYFYVSELGEIGPLAAQGTTGLALGLRHAVHQAGRRPGPVTLRVPGACREALEMLLAAGFRLTGGNLLLSTRELVGLDRYLPGDDSLF